MTAELPPVTDSDVIILGKLNGVFGTRGWLKVYSYTRPRENILTYAQWYLAQAGSWCAYRIVDHKRQGTGLIACLEGITARGVALGWVGAEIAIARAMLPAAQKGEYYWADLVGLTVSNVAGLQLGRITRILATGANDVLVVEGDEERLIPYVPEHYIVRVDIELGCMLVDWHKDD